MTFIDHNVLLDNGQKTVGENRLLLSESGLWKSIEKTINHFFVANPGQNKSDVRVVDLGCFEGGYAAQFARMGFQSLGIEAREDNLEKCNYIKDHLSLPNLNFVLDDVRNMAKYGKFDITLCYGLLYHLDDPINFINLLSSCTTKILFLSTHYAPERDLTYGLGEPINRYVINPIQKRVPFLNYRRNYKLSSVQTNEGYRGRWYTEWAPSEEKSKIEKNFWASYNNHRSFWPLKTELVKALHKAGFHSVFEQFDFTGDSMTPENYQSYLNRGMFVAFK